MDLPIRSFLNFALDATWQAGRITLSHFQTGVKAERKGDNSPVTIADRASEQKMRDLISQSWPDYGLLGEEFGQTPGASKLTWIIDPIDGTKSFVQGVPLYAVLLALVDEQQSALVGVAHFPGLNETVYAARGEGCFWNGRPAHVSTVNQMDQAVLLASDVSMHTSAEKESAWRRLEKATYFRRTWGDAYGYALVATGRAEMMVDDVVKVWDIAPFQVIMEEAGGTLTDWRGQRTINGGESLATNGVLFEQVRAIIG